MLDHFTGMLDDVDLLFFGRVMYQLMFPYWSDVAKDQSGSTAENGEGRFILLTGKPEKFFRVVQLARLW